MPSFHPLPSKGAERSRQCPGESCIPPWRQGMQSPTCAGRRGALTLAAARIPFDSLTAAHFLSPASGAKLLSAGLRRSCPHDTEASRGQLTCQSNAVLSERIKKSTGQPPLIGGSGSVPPPLLRALCSPVQFGVAIWRFLPVSKIASGTFPVDFPRQCLLSNAGDHGSRNLPPRSTLKTFS